MARTAALAVAVAAVSLPLQTSAVEQPFRPFANPGYVSVNAVAFADNGRTMYSALFVDRAERQHTSAHGKPVR